MKNNTIYTWLSVSVVIHIFLLLWMRLTPLAVQQIEGERETIVVSIIDPVEAAAIPPLPVPPPINDPSTVINKPGVPLPLGNSNRTVPGPPGPHASNGPGVGATVAPALMAVDKSDTSVASGATGGQGNGATGPLGSPGNVGETRGAKIESIGKPIYPKGHTDGDETTVTISINVGTNGKYTGHSVVIGADWAANAAVLKAQKGSYQVALENGVAVAGTVTKSWRFNGNGTVTEL